MYTTLKERMAAQIILLLMRTLFSGKFIIQYALCLAVGLIMQYLKQRAARKKHHYNQSCHYATLEDSIVKSACLCCRQFFFSCVCLAHLLHTTPNKEYTNISSAPVPVQPISLTEAMSHQLQIITYLI